MLVKNKECKHDISLCTYFSKSTMSMITGGAETNNDQP